MKQLGINEILNDSARLLEVIESARALARFWEGKMRSGLSREHLRLIDAFKPPSLRPSVAEISRAHKYGSTLRGKDWEAASRWGIEQGLKAAKLGVSKTAGRGHDPTQEAVEAIAALEDELARTEFGR